MVMQSLRPGALVLATEVDPVAAAVLAATGWSSTRAAWTTPARRAYRRVDVMFGVLPYVPRLPPSPAPGRGGFEPRPALDGGPDGLDSVSEVVRRSRRWVRPGGWLALEVGADQIGSVGALFEAAGYRAVEVLEDADGDPRAVVGRWAA